MSYCWWKNSCTTWYIGSLSHYLQGFIHPRWFGISEPSTVLVFSRGRLEVEVIGGRKSWVWTTLLGGDIQPGFHGMSPPGFYYWLMVQKQKSQNSQAPFLDGAKTRVYIMGFQLPSHSTGQFAGFLNQAKGTSFVKETFPTRMSQEVSNWLGNGL